MVGVIGLFVVIQFVTMYLQSPMLPSPATVLVSVVRLLMTGEINEHINSSLVIIIAGIGFAFVFGFLLGVLFYLAPKLEIMFMPLLNAMRPISAIALMPLFIVLFGTGHITKIIIIFWTAWPSVLLNTVHGLRTVEKEVVEATKIDGANKVQTLVVIIPVALSSILTGLRIAISGGWISLVAAEMIGANSGLGFYVLLKAQTFEYEKMFAGIIYIGLIGFCMNALLEVVQRRYVCGKKGSQ
jgi:ABC-type nitrate/sulfonate/bicarbonate transport system permease component